MYALFRDGESRTEGPDRDRWGLWISGYAPVRDADGRVIALLGIDLPANRFIGDALAYASLPLLASLALLALLWGYERVRRRERLLVEQKAEFLSIASHEIRTPLTGIRWAVEGLLKDELPEAMRSTLALVHENSLRMLARVNNLLDLNALDGRGKAMLKKEPIDMRGFLAEIAATLELSAREREVSINIGPSVDAAGTITADREMLHHAFFNLLANALKYTKRGTSIEVSYARSGAAHEFRVKDGGPGIPAEEAERIFEGYHRTDGAKRSGAYGTGLGLYLARKAMTLHGGSVVLEPGEGGATFLLTLPAA